MAELYVETGYVESGYVEGEEIIEPSIMDLRVIIDTKGYSEQSILDFVSNEFSEDEAVAIFSKDGIKMSMLGSVFDVAGNISESVRNELLEYIKLNLLQDNSFISSIKKQVADNLGVSIIAQDGREITSSFYFDKDKNAYVLDYDTSLLDGSDYTIEISLEN